MSLINEDDITKYTVSGNEQNNLKVFTDSAIANMPNLARAYLFQVIYKDGTIEHYDLMLKTRKVDFDPDGKGITVQFDEFQDFQVLSTLNEFVRNKNVLNIKMNFFNSDLKRVLYTHELNEVVCRTVYPLNMDCHSPNSLIIMAHFR